MLLILPGGLLMDAANSWRSPDRCHQFLDVLRRLLEVIGCCSFVKVPTGWMLLVLSGP